MDGSEEQKKRRDEMILVSRFVISTPGKSQAPQSGFLRLPVAYKFCETTKRLLRQTQSFTALCKLVGKFGDQQLGKHPITKGWFHLQSNSGQRLGFRQLSRHSKCSRSNEIERTHTGTELQRSLQMQDPFGIP